MAQHSARTFTGWYDTDRVSEWSASLARQIEAIQRAVAGTTDAYLARALSSMVGGRVRPVGRVDVSSLRVGVTHAGAYARAADVYRWQQSQFDTAARSLLTAPTPTPPALIDPVAAAVDRVAAVADMDVQLADRAQSQQVLADAADRRDIRGYRRVIHPELSQGGTCGLCIAASDRFYHVADLRAVHARCACTVLPVVGQQDPGSGLNNLDLGALYEHAGSTDGRKLKATRYQFDEHGELGVVLAPKGSKTRTARTADREANKPPRRAKTPAEKAAQVRRIRDDLAASLPKAHALAAKDPQEWGPFVTRIEARIADLDHQLAA
jgi:hypothetical protein